MKKMLCVLMILAILTAAAVSVSAKSVITVGEWTVEKVDDGFSVVSCSSSSGGITLIKEIGGVDVTAVGEYAFSGSETLRSFTASSPLLRIGGYAFQNASELRAVRLPSSLKEIGVFAFAGTSLLRDINLGDTSVEAIPAYAFMSAGIQSVTLPKACTYIADNAFLNCGELRSIYIPDAVTDIGENAFDGCSDLTILCAPDSYAAQYARAHHISAESAIFRGDADHDGRVTIIDATKIQRFLAKLAEDPDGYIRLAGDVDGDGLNIIDATRIQRYLARIENPYNIGESVFVV